MSVAGRGEGGCGELALDQRMSGGHRRNRVGVEKWGSIVKLQSISIEPFFVGEAGPLSEDETWRHRKSRCSDATHLPSLSLHHPLHHVTVLATAIVSDGLTTRFSRVPLLYSFLWILTPWPMVFW